MLTLRLDYSDANMPINWFLTSAGHMTRRIKCDEEHRQLGPNFTSIHIDTNISSTNQYYFICINNVWYYLINNKRNSTNQNPVGLKSPAISNSSIQFEKNKTSWSWTVLCIWYLNAVISVIHPPLQMLGCTFRISNELQWTVITSRDIAHLVQ